jgi:hypothetical protein
LVSAREALNNDLSKQALHFVLGAQQAHGDLMDTME